LQLFTYWSLASQFVGEVFEEDGMALRLPIRNTLDKARFLMFFFRAGDTCGAIGRPARQTIDNELEKIPLTLFASKILRNAEWF